MQIAFRVDCSSKIGSGHLVRCLNLGRQLNKNFKKIFFLVKKSDYFEINQKFILQNKFKPIIFGKDDKTFSLKSDITSTLKICKKKKIDTLIVDNYQIDHNWENRVKKKIKKLIVIDDLANRKHNCDILIDQNYVKNLSTRYNNLTNKNCLKLLGPKYTLLNNSFNNLKFSSDHKVKRIFIFFSTVFKSNLYNLVTSVLSKKEFKNFKIDYVVGNISKKKIIKLKKKLPTNFRLFSKQKNLHRLMKKSSFAIGSGGTNTWERINLALPSIVFCISPNQKNICNFLDQKNIIHYLGVFKKNSKSKLYLAIRNMIYHFNKKKDLALENKSLIDGYGTKRINFFLNKKKFNKISFKKISILDTDLLFMWANDTNVRQNSFSKKTISYKEHQRWLHKKLLDKKSILLKLMIDRLPVGQIRFDKKKNFYHLDYSIDKAFRNLGLGKLIIKESIKKFIKRNNTIIAEVKKANLKSIKIFQSLNFKEIKNNSYNKSFELNT